MRGKALRTKTAAAVLLAAWSCAAPLRARSGGAEPESPDKSVEKKIPAPEKRSGYRQYNDYSHSTGESVGMLALDALAWIFAVILVPVFAIAALFSFLIPK